MRGVYNASIQISGLAAARTLMYITAPSLAGVEILSVAVTNATNETNEQLEIELAQIGTLGTPTATTVTPAKNEQGDQAAACTVKGNVTASEPTFDTTFYDRQAFASLSGYYFSPMPEERPIIKPAASAGLYLVTAPSSAITFNVNIRFRELC